MNKNQDWIDEIEKKNSEEPAKKAVAKDAPVPTRKPFPYWPAQVPIEEMKRMEVMMELNKWANNDPFMAKRSAETLILLLAEQFEINILKINQ